MEDTTPSPVSLSASREIKKWYIFPEFHDDIESSAPHMTFENNPHRAHPTKEWETRVVGTFICTDKQCKVYKWTSGTIATNIRLYNKNKYNALVYNQRCRKCNSLGRMEIDRQTYIDRVSRRLKVWSNIPVEEIEIRERATPPHRSDKCEGCKAGHCLGSGNRSRF